MKIKAVFIVLVAAMGIALAAGQTRAPKDPELIDAQGYQRVLQQYKGKPILVTFWATWCEPCRDEYPMLNELAKRYAPKGLQVVGVNFDQDGDLILMRRFLARNKPIFPNYRKKKGDEDAFSEAVMPGYNGSLPATFFYARDGRQVGHVFGAGDHDTFDTAIRNLLAN